MSDLLGFHVDPDIDRIVKSINSLAPFPKIIFSLFLKFLNIKLFKFDTNGSKFCGG